MFQNAELSFPIPVVAAVKLSLLLRIFDSLTSPVVFAKLFFLSQSALSLLLYPQCFSETFGLLLYCLGPNHLKYLLSKFLLHTGVSMHSF